MQYSTHETDIGNRLSILFLENIPADVAEAQATFAKEGIECTISQVQTRDEFVSALAQADFDLILADTKVPLFDGISALHVAKKACPHTPVIMIADSAGEDTALSALQHGAADYVLKQRMPDLANSAKRALRQNQNRRQISSGPLQSLVSETRYRLLFEKMVHGFAYHRISFSANGQITDCIVVEVNQAFELLFGLTRAELIGKRTREVFSADHPDLDFVEKLAESILNGDEARLEQYMPASERWLSIRAYSPEPGYVATIVEDITEYKKEETQRVKLKQELRHAQKMESIGQLAGGIAHDFSNLLMPIIVYSEMILKDLSLQDPRYKQAKYIWDAADKAKNLAKQLLAFGRKQVLEMKTLDVNHVLANFQSMLRRTIREDIDIQFFPCDKPCIFRGDISQIEQILINLAVNAQDAMPEGGTITIKTEVLQVTEIGEEEITDLTPGRYVVIEFIDTGTGMDAETASRVFDPFFTTKKLGKGTGLGLSTAFGIAKQHGGNIVVNSRLGKGTCFKVYLPREMDELEIQEESVPPLPDIASGNETLLVVEDDAIARETISHILKLAGYKVLLAEDGPQALELARKYHDQINLLVTDVIMPHMNGYDLYKTICKSRSNMKVLFVSGYTTEAAQERGIDHSEIRHLPKPFTVKSLTDKVREVLEA